MSGTNFGRGSQLSYHQVNSQKTLIYDLRSELSNLKNQFSRLISRPNDLTGKSKIENRPALKSRYSCVQSENETQESQISNTQETQALRKSQEVSPRFTFHRTEAPTVPNTYSNSSSYRLSAICRKNSTGQTLTPVNAAVLNENNQKAECQLQKVETDNLIVNSTNRIKQFSNFYKKVHSTPNHVQSSKNNCIKSEQLNQSVNVDSTFQAQLAAAENKCKQLQQENMINIEKIKNLQRNNNELGNLVHHMQREIQQFKNGSQKKNEKNTKLQEQVRELTQKISRANEQTLQINRQKTKQIQNLKQYHVSEIKNQQKDFQKRLTIQRQNLQLRSEGLLNSLKQSSEAKINDAINQKNKIQLELNSTNQKFEKLKIQSTETDKKRMGFENLVKQKNNQVNKLNQSIRILSQRVSQLEKQNNAHKIRAESKQIGINTEKKQQKAVEAPTAAPGALGTNEAQQQKQMQQKLNIYLNNIDKQSMKIKEQKSELDKCQRIIQQGNRIVCEKQAALRNIMRDFKALEKQLHQNRRVKREVEVILDDYNESINRLSLFKLNNKYTNIS